MQAELRLRLQEIENLAGVLLRLDGFGTNDLERGKDTARWIVETLDINNQDDGGMHSVANWADVCVALGWSSLMKQGILTSFEQCKAIGIADIAPLCSLGTHVIHDFVGSRFEKLRANNLLHLHKLLVESHQVQEYDWVKGVVQDIEVMHLDLTGQYDTTLMTP